MHFYLHIVLLADVLQLEVKGRGEVEVEVVAGLGGDVPHTLDACGVRSRPVGGADTAVQGMVHAPATCNTHHSC